MLKKLLGRSLISVITVGFTLNTSQVFITGY